MESLVGRRFGKLVVTGFSHQDKHFHTIWTCLCQCGKTHVVARSSLTRGFTKSCGCDTMKHINNRRTHKIIEGEERKRCHKCGKWLAFSDFFKSAESWDGLQKKCKNCFSEYTNKNSERVNARLREYAKERRDSDAVFRIRHNLGSRIVRALRGRSKSLKTIELLGCSVENLKSHLENGFTSDMNWENYGSYWHVDHIKPCASFDLSDAEQQKMCFHYTNLQPLEAIENIRKGSRF